MIVKNIVFDMGNVLLSYNPERYVHRIIRDPDAAENVLRELFRGPEWKQLDAGTISEEQAILQVQSRIPRYSDNVKLAMKHWHTDLTPINGMPELVGQLKAKGYKIYLLSNMSLRFFQFYQQVELFQKFDGFLISAKEKLVKPDAAIYQCLCSRFDLIPQECLFIDDLQENINGAVREGFHGHVFDGSEELNAFFMQENIL